MVDAELVAFLQNAGGAKANAAKLWSINGGKVQVGTVLFAQWEREFVLVRKEPKEKYEFSDKLVMPGGLVRAADTEAFSASFATSLLARVKDEAGLDETDLTDIEVLPTWLAPVSRYTAKGASRLTIVFPVKATLVRRVELVVTSGSIREARYACSDLDWNDIAPANRIIMAHILGDQLSPDARASCERPLQEALAYCNAATADAGMPPVRVPWSR